MLDTNPIIRDYVERLSLLQPQLTAKSDVCYYACISHGLTEELLELHFANTRDKKVREAGDVFAYATLLLMSSALEDANDNTSANTIYDDVAYLLTYAIEFSISNSPLFSALECASALKRYFRFELDTNDECIASYAADAVAYVLPNVDIREILETNLSKLEDRAKRGLLDKGRGDDR